MTATDIRRSFVLSATVAFLLLGCGPQVTPVPPPEPPEDDPIIHVSVPGAYGVAGGDQILQPSRQISVLFSGKTFSFRILDPYNLTVVSISGLPVGFSEGDLITLYYRLSKGGKTQEYEVYENVRILRINDTMAWLKVSEDVFFVIQLL